MHNPSTSLITSFKHSRYNQEAILQNLSHINKHFDLPLAKLFSKEIIGFLDKMYFRSELVGFEEDYPERPDSNSPLIFVSNHSGMAFPWDAIIFVHRLHELKSYGPEAVRTLTAPPLSAITLMNSYQIKHFWKKLGGTLDATLLNFETLMNQSDFNILTYPEGVPGIGKGFNKRYQIQKLSHSMVRMSIKYKTDIIPFATVNGEYINPWSYSIKWVNRLSSAIGIPFLPLGFITPFVIIFPWIFYMAFPARLIYVKGKRIQPYLMTSKPFEEMRYKDFREITEKIHQQMQEELNQAVALYGRQPYRIWEHFKIILKNFKYFPFSVPLGWPLLFAEFERKRIKKKDLVSPLHLGWGSVLRIIFQNPWVLVYYIPVIGWIPLALRGFKKNKE